MRRSSPFGVISREPEVLTWTVAFQTKGFALGGTLEYQMEKVKRFEEFGRGKKPAVKFLFGERRVLFCAGSHGECEMLKDVNCCWETEG